MVAFVNDSYANVFKTRRTSKRLLLQAPTSSATGSGESSGGGDATGAPVEKRTTAVASLLTFLVMILPVVSKRVCQSFRCASFDGGDDDDYLYLAADLSIDCHGERYAIMTSFAAVMILVFPIGMPSILAIMLWKRRDKLRPKRPAHVSVSAWEAHVVSTRRADPALLNDPVASYAMIYRPKFYAYECYNILRRLAYTCGATVCESLAQTTVLVAFVSVTTLVIERESRPHISLVLSAFTYAMHLEVGQRVTITVLLPPSPPNLLANLTTFHQISPNLLKHHHISPNLPIPPHPPRS